MSGQEKCKFCERKGKRFCKRENGYICSRCCGEQRDLMECPPECDYLKLWLKSLNNLLKSLKKLEYQEIQRNQFQDLQKNLAKQTIFQRLLFISLPDGISYGDNDVRAFLAYLKEFFRIRRSGLIYTPPFNNHKTRLWFEQFMKKKEEFENIQLRLTDDEFLDCIGKEERTLEWYKSKRFAKNPYLTQLIFFSPEIEGKRIIPSV